MNHSFISRYLFNPEKIRGSKSLRFLGDSINAPNVWYRNRHYVARAFAIGLFVAMIPIPMQMLAAALMAIPLNANLPISVGLVWVTNPITTPPVLYANYKLGAWLLDTPAMQMPDNISFRWVIEVTTHHWQPLYLGSFVMGALLAALGYFGVKYYWQWKTGRNWKKRLKERSLRQ